MNITKRTIYGLMGAGLVIGATFVLFRFGEESTGNGWFFLLDTLPFIVIFSFGAILLCMTLPKKWVAKLLKIVGEGT